MSKQTAWQHRKGQSIDEASKNTQPSFFSYNRNSDHLTKDTETFKLLSLQLN